MTSLEEYKNSLSILENKFKTCPYDIQVQVDKVKFWLKKNIEYIEGEKKTRTFKVVKIWFVDADSEFDAVTRVGDNIPYFVSVNDKFRIGKDKLKKKE